MKKNTVKYGAAPFEFHTHSMEDLRNISHMGECEFQVVKLIWYF